MIVMIDFSSLMISAGLWDSQLRVLGKSRLICMHGKSPGFWKNNIRKALEGRESGTQVSKQSIINALDAITIAYGDGSIWDFDWLTFEGTDAEKLSQASVILDYGGQS